MTTSPKFKVGDLVYVAPDAKYLDFYGSERPTGSAGKTLEITDLPNMYGNYTLGGNYNVQERYLTKVGDTSTSQTTSQVQKFKRGDWVYIAPGATATNGIGQTIKCSLAGMISEVTAGPDKDGDYLFTNDSRAKIMRTAHGRFLRLATQAEIDSGEPDLSSNPPHSSTSIGLYCTCNGPTIETGIGLLIIKVCDTCKKEKKG